MPTDRPRRPSAAEKLDFAGRLTDILEEAGRSIAAARACLRTGREDRNTREFPMFPDDGQEIDGLLEVTSGALYKARRLTGIQGFAQWRATQDDSVHDNEGTAP